MGLIAKQRIRYHVQAQCDKCQVGSEALIVDTKSEGYLKLKQLGWKIQRNKKKALCKKCQRGD